MKPRQTTTILALLLAGMLTILPGCTCDAPPMPEEVQSRPIALTLNCGTDVSLLFHLTGRAEVNKQMLLASKCHISILSGTITMTCPGNNLNWTEYTEQQIKQTTTRGLSAPATAPEAEYSIPGIER